MTDDGAADAPNTVDEQSFEDEIAMDPLVARGDGSYAVATPSTSGNLPLAFTCKPDSKSIFLGVITLDPTTFTAGERLTIKMKILRYKTSRN